MKRVYLASPFFNDKEIGILEQVEKILDEKGLNVFSPLRNQMDEYVEVGSRQWSIETFMNDIKHIKWAEIVVGIYHGNYSDSGTAWELGYAYATDKPVIDRKSTSELQSRGHLVCRLLLEKKKNKRTNNTQIH